MTLYKSLYESPFFIFWTVYALWGAYMMLSNIHTFSDVNHQINASPGFYLGFGIVIMYITVLSTVVFCIWWYNRHDVWTGKRI